MGVGGGARGEEEEESLSGEHSQGAPQQLALPSPAISSPRLEPAPDGRCSEVQDSVAQRSLRVFLPVCRAWRKRAVGVPGSQEGSGTGGHAEAWPEGREETHFKALP